MTRENNPDVTICPHCGAENIPASNPWQTLTATESGTGNTETETASGCHNCNQDMTGAGRSETPVYRNPENSGYLAKFLVIAALLAGLIIGLNLFFHVLNFKEDFARIVYMTIVIVVISLGLASGRTGQKLKYLFIWAGIFLMLMVGYAYRHDLNRVKAKVLAEFVPMQGYQQTPASISFPLSDDGHYYIRARVNDVPITFMADTGASHIVIAPRDAVRLGLNPGALTFDRFYETANGTVRGSSIRLDTFNVGDLHFDAIHASVNEADMRHSLLGMTFFNRLRGYEVRDDVLTLHW